MKRLLIAEILTGDFLFTWTSQAETVAINYSCANSKSLSFCITLNVEHISGIKLSRIGGIAAAASHGPTPKLRTGTFRWRVNLYLGNYSPLGNHSRRREQRRCAFFPLFFEHLLLRGCLQCLPLAAPDISVWASADGHRARRDGAWAVISPQLKHSTESLPSSSGATERPTPSSYSSTCSVCSSSAARFPSAFSSARRFA